MRHNYFEQPACCVTMPGNNENRRAMYRRLSNLRKALLPSPLMTTKRSNNAEGFITKPLDDN
jgi:hypothetical protein